MEDAFHVGITGAPKNNVRKVPTKGLWNIWYLPTPSMYLEAVIATLTRFENHRNLSFSHLHNLPMTVGADVFICAFPASLWMLEAMIGRSRDDPSFCPDECAECAFVFEILIRLLALIAGTIFGIKFTKELKRVGWTARMGEVSCELRKRCLDDTGPELKKNIKDLQRRNLEECIREILLDCGDMLKEDGEDSQDFLDPAFRDIMLQ
jgi:hypothetical protein